MSKKGVTRWRELVDCPCVMGSEAELTLLSAEGAATTAEATARNAAELVAEIRRLTPAVAGEEGGVFTPAGRLYVDGAYLEIATAECASPWETVATMRTLERLVEHARQRLWKKRRQVTGVCRANVHTVVGTTAGVHDNFAVADSVRSVRDLLPHLASQVIYTGAGGLDPYHPGIVPILSPRRRLLLRRPASRRLGWLMEAREPHARSTLRIHVVGGEQLCFERGAVLRLGTTALVLKLIEQGKRPGRGLRLQSPPQAIDGFSRGAGYRARLVRGERVSAVELQRVYLKRVARYARASFMPEWAEPLVELWEETLSYLEAGAGRASGQPWFDWEAKARLFDAYLASAGFSRAKVNQWNKAVTALAWMGAEIVGQLPSNDLPLGSARRALQADFALRLPTRRSRRGRHLDLHELQKFLALRRRLLELELRFCLLGPGGLAWRLPVVSTPGPYAGSPLLDSLKIASVGPVAPRAQARAALIQQHSHEHDSWRCNWDEIVSRHDRRRARFAEVATLEPDWSCRRR